MPIDGEFPSGIQTFQVRCDRIKLSDFLIAIQIKEDGSWVEIYNGPGDLVWENAGKMQKNGQRPISVAKLKALMKTVPDSQRIKPIERE